MPRPGHFPTWAPAFFPCPLSGTANDSSGLSQMQKEQGSHTALTPGDKQPHWTEMFFRSVTTSMAFLGAVQTGASGKGANCNLWVECQLIWFIGFKEFSMDHLNLTDS